MQFNFKLKKRKLKYQLRKKLENWTSGKPQENISC